MNIRFSAKMITVALLVAIFLLALYIRAGLPLDKVFVDDWIKFTSNDAYYHMRFVDSLVHNFPKVIKFDPYFIYPGGGSGAAGTHFFDWLLTGIIWLVGLGSPTQTTIDVVGVIFPAVLGAMIVFPVYFIGRELFNRWAGLAAAVLVSVLPGEFLGRSILGFTDHHVAEVLFTTVALMFLILALKSAKRSSLDLRHLKDWQVIKSPSLLYSLGCGLFLGIYFLTWVGALLFIFIVTIFCIIQILISHLQGKSTDYMAMVSSVTMMTVLIITLPFSLRSLHIVAIILALMVPLVLVTLSRLLTQWKMKSFYFPLIALGIGIVGAAIFHTISPSLFWEMWRRLSIFVPPTGAALTTTEMQPFFAPLVENGGLQATPAWMDFSTSLFLGSIGLILFIIVSYRKRCDSEKVLFLVWTLVILLMVAAQRRFAYYLTINVALISGYFTALAYVSIDAITRHFTGDSGFKRSAQIMRRIKVFTGMPLAVDDASTKKLDKKPQRAYLTGRIVATLVTVVVIFFLVFYPNIGRAVEIAKAATFAPSDGWYESLNWLKENTPEPFDDPDYYHAFYEPPYLEPAYAVLSWWDYGYWISRVAHRLPYANPSQQWEPITYMSRYFLQQKPAAAIDWITTKGVKYVMIDYSLTGADPLSKFWAIVRWAGGNDSEYAGIYYQRTEKGLNSVQLYYPAYYRSMIVRLYNFDGCANVPELVQVISYENKMMPQGERYREITNVWKFRTYEEAEEFVATEGGRNFKIVGANPFKSIVPLEELIDYELIYSSTQSIDSWCVDDEPEVKIFRFSGGQ